MSLGLKQMRRRSARFSGDQSGAVAPIIGLTFIMLILAAGFAIDVGRGTLVKARLSDALDAAGLAVGAKLSSTSNYDAEALRYVSANFKAGYAGATVDSSSVKAVVSTDKSTITLSASATLPTAFMRIVGTNTMKVSAASEIKRATTGLEVSLVLDNTTSMSNSMGTLRTAANSLVDTLFGADTTADNLFVSVVPFSQTVNIGTKRSSWVAFKDSEDKNWKGCVMARGDGLDQNDQPPSGQNYLFAAYLYPGKDSGKYCPTEISAPSNVKSVSKAAITAMKANGYTHVNLGAVWGWRMVSPNWRNYWGTVAWKGTTLPLDYHTDKMQKAVVLMTDGANTMNKNNYTAYGYLSAGKLGTTDSESKAVAELDSRLGKVCGSMKTEGIIVYTVAFNIKEEEKHIKEILQSCATSTSLYFDAANDAALAQAFARIADSLSNLRVSK